LQACHSDFAAYLIFFFWDILAVFLIYRYAVETKQMSLEDMDGIFDAANPKQHSLELNRKPRSRVAGE
jgi:hypothetical protein